LFTASPSFLERPNGDAAIVILVEVVPPSFSIDDYLQKTLIDLTIHTPNIDILEAYLKPISGQAAGIVEYTRPGADVEPELSHVTVRTFHAVLIKDGVGWGAGCTAYDDKATTVETCKAVVRSFELTN